MFRLLITILGAIIAFFFVKHLLEKTDIVERVKKVNSRAFYAVIQEKKKHAVSVGIFGRDDEYLGNLEIRHDKGVSDDIRVGEKIHV